MSANPSGSVRFLGFHFQFKQEVRRNSQVILHLWLSMRSAVTNCSPRAANPNTSGGAERAKQTEPVTVDVEAAVRQSDC